MSRFFLKFNNFFSNFEALGSLFFRFGVGIAFVIYGLGKFPLPPEGLIEYFGLPPILASVVAISELFTVFYAALPFSILPEIFQPSPIKNSAKGIIANGAV